MQSVQAFAGTIISFAMAGSAALAASDIQLIHGGVEGFAATWAAGATKTLLDSQAQGKALRLTVETVPEQVWLSQTWIAPLAVDMARGDTIRITFVARCTQPATGQVCASLGANSAPWTSTVEQKVELTHDWKTYTVTGVAAAPLPAGAARFGFFFGYQTQTIEIARLRVAKQGPK